MSAARKPRAAARKPAAPKAPPVPPVYELLADMPPALAAAHQAARALGGREAAALILALLFDLDGERTGDDRDEIGMAFHDAAERHKAEDARARAQGLTGLGARHGLSAKAYECFETLFLIPPLGR